MGLTDETSKAPVVTFMYLSRRLAELLIMLVCDLRGDAMGCDSVGRKGKKGEDRTH
jgi:hypothetical protein